MATNEQYESAAKNLAKEIRESSDPVKKARTMTYLGNLRYSQYITTKEPKARKLAGNCYIAARQLSFRTASA